MLVVPKHMHLAFSVVEPHRRMSAEQYNLTVGTRVTTQQNWQISAVIYLVVFTPVNIGSSSESSSVQHMSWLHLKQHTATSRLQPCLTRDFDAAFSCKTLERYSPAQGRRSLQSGLPDERWHTQISDRAPSIADRLVHRSTRSCQTPRTPARSQRRMGHCG